MNPIFLQLLSIWTICTPCQLLTFVVFESPHTGAPFKPSAKKGHKEVEFAPTNLHIHRAWVQNEAKDICKLSNALCNLM